MMSTTKEVRLSDIIAKPFIPVYQAIRSEDFTHYILKGGRGSTKSTFAALMIILGMIRDENANAICFRKVGETLRNSVYDQILWIIDLLGLRGKFYATASPMQITYLPTDQTILFRGLDKAKKQKSIKLRKGFFKFIWFEELDEFKDKEEIRTVLQSLLRGGDGFSVLYSFNPPKQINHWVNEFATELRDDTLVHSSTYLDVPKSWLGEQFIIEAEHLKATKPDAYKHEYLGEAIGTGGQVFDNVTIRRITTEEREQFDRIRYGLDFGYAADPLACVAMHYDAARRRLYLLNEIYQTSLRNAQAVELIQRINPSNKYITADSAEPRTIAELNGLGLRILPAKKGPDSVNHGIKWLTDLDEIIIDPDTCPNAKREFIGYELQQDSHGNFKGEYPDKDNHTIDAVRYGNEQEILQRKIKVLNRNAIRR